ncbi:hypothetical protein OBBRIDRAFT_836860 [Obba rivulosa]|uniref:Uncharacterized protein n=1 Tax=Obba rivulosa TaxID=1052685 RepID=A0A8E2DHF0_9APHY|nr:hypothetical protein OBBRIDRAFT_836860 [Obba rivulosa]
MMTIKEEPCPDVKLFPSHTFEEGLGFHLEPSGDSVDKRAPKKEFSMENMSTPPFSSKGGMQPIAISSRYTKRRRYGPYYRGCRGGVRKQMAEEAEVLGIISEALAGAATSVGCDSVPTVSEEDVSAGHPMRSRDALRGVSPVGLALSSSSQSLQSSDSGSQRATPSPSRIPRTYASYVIRLSLASPGSRIHRQ